MKKITLLAAFVVAFLMNTTQSFAQCPGCIVDVSCHPPGGGLCPDSLPAGTQGVYYDEDVTCYIPMTIDAGPFSGGVLGVVPLLSMHIDAISGLPFGLNWTCNHPGNNFAPSSGDTLGCVKICGTPLSAPGVYNVTVAVTAGIDAGALGTQYGNTTFNFQMVLFANSSGNLAFNYSPSSACDSGGFAFTPNINFGLPQVTEYDWDFGIGGTVHSTTPATQNVIFSSPGDYPVTLTTTIYNLALTSFSTVASGNFWCGDVEETNWPFVGCTAAPDLYFIFTHGSSNYTSSSGSDNTTQSWTGLSIPLSSTVISVQVWDEDAVSADDNGGTSAQVLTGPGVYGYSTSSPFGGGSSGQFTIGLVVDTVIIVTDTIHVYPLPAPPTLISSSPDFCPGDSVMLTATPGYTYEWYKNDSILLATNTTNTYWVNEAANYSVTIYNSNGCSSTSPSVTVTQNTPILWTFSIQWNVPNQWLQSSLTGTISYQWQEWNGSAYVNIPAPEGVQSHYTPTGNGMFALIAMNPAGCSDTAFYNLTTFGIEDDGLVSSVLIYPNPTSNTFTLDLKDVKGDEVKVSIISMMGQTVLDKIFQVNGGQIKETIDVADFANGVYTVDIKIGNSNIRKKLIKD